jgi:hypothetical protein
VDTDEQRLLAFYEGTGMDDAGRTLSAILASDVETLEAEHDFIQWLFPLPERSPVNPEAASLQAHGATRLQGHGAREAD